jgi:predicted transcriptional regulator
VSRRRTIRKHAWLGEHLRRLRVGAGMSLADAQEVLAMEYSRIGSYERGDRAVTVDVANEMLRCFGQQLAVVPLDERNTPPEPNYPAMLRALADKLDAAKSTP